MSRRHARIALGAAALIAAGLVAGAIVWATGGNTPKIKGTTQKEQSSPLSHERYTFLYTNAVIKKTRISILHRWPTPPYQTYRSGLNQCYEWYDKPVALYSLCFKNGLLVDKAI